MPKKLKKMWDLGLSEAEEEQCSLSMKPFNHECGQPGLCFVADSEYDFGSAFMPF